MAASKRANGFPGESLEYRRARNRLLSAEIKLRRQIEAVAAQRRELPLGGQVREDYAFDSMGPGGTRPGITRLSELFAPGKRTLFLYNFMYPNEEGVPCPSCTSIIDSVDGAAQHVAQRINLVVVAKAPIADFHDHARRRGWRHVHLLSSARNSFNRDYRAENEDGMQLPLAHVFVKRGRKIHHTWSSELLFTAADPGQDKRHVDFIWPVWSILDCTPEGRGRSWGPELEYS